MEYYSAIEKNEILPPVATWMDLENIILNEVRWREKDKYYMISLKSKKIIQMNLYTNQRYELFHTHTHTQTQTLKIQINKT